MSDVVDQSEHPPALLPGWRMPPFPESVQRQGYEGSVLVGFVVDTEGHVRRGSVVVLSSTDPGLSRWACDAALVVRLDPARNQVRAVAAQVTMPFVYNGPPVTSPNDSVPHVIERP